MAQDGVLAGPGSNYSTGFTHQANSDLCASIAREAYTVSCDAGRLRRWVTTASSHRRAAGRGAQGDPGEADLASLASALLATCLDHRAELPGRARGVGVYRRLGIITAETADWRLRFQRRSPSHCLKLGKPRVLTPMGSALGIKGDLVWATLSLSSHVNRPT